LPEISRVDFILNNPEKGVPYPHCIFLIITAYSSLLNPASMANIYYSSSKILEKAFIYKSIISALGYISKGT
jgi:hypothetical protein